MQLLYQFLGLCFCLTMKFTVFYMLLVKINFFLQQFACNFLLAILQSQLSLRSALSRHLGSFINTLFHSAFIGHLLRHSNFCFVNFCLHIAQILVQHHNWVLYLIQHVVYRRFCHIFNSFEYSHNLHFSLLVFRQFLFKFFYFFFHCLFLNILHHGIQTGIWS